MRFFLDETSFALQAGTTVETFESHVERLVALLRALHEHEDTVFRWSALEQTQVMPGALLVDLLYTAASTIDRDTRLALVETINRCVLWDDLIDPVPAFQVDIEGAPCTAPTIAVVHARIAGAEGASCLTLGVRSDRIGVFRVRVAGTTLDVHFVSAEAQLPSFYRSLFEIENLEPARYMENALDAFPDIGFVPGLAAMFAKFETGYREVRPIVTAHLAALNDRFRGLFMTHRGLPFETSRELLSTAGVDASPESPKTRRNKAAMKERDIEVDTVQVGRRTLRVGRTVRCEWHTKIRPTSDRIHFHPGDADVAEGRLIVGLFVAHCTT